MSAFQRRADQYPQLSAESQLELHVRYRAGIAARATLEAGGVRGRAVVPLRRAVSDGERAMEYLVASNFRLVLLIAREQAERRYGRERAAGVLSDLVAEANVALTEAVTTFDASRGPRLSTWAAQQIRSRVRAALGVEDTPIDVPSSWRRLKRIASVRIPKLADVLGHPPSVEQIQEDLTQYCMAWAMDRLTPDELALDDAGRRERAAAKLRKQGMESAIRDVERILQLTANATSLDAPLTDDGSRTVGDQLSSATDDSTVDAMDVGSLQQALGQAMSELSEREQRIVLLRYGFVDGTNHTFNEICTEFGVTAERIRQIERKVLTKLRTASPLRDQLAAFLPSLDDTDLDAMPSL